MMVAGAEPEALAARLAAEELVEPPAALVALVELVEPEELAERVELVEPEALEERAVPVAKLPR